MPPITRVYLALYVIRGKGAPDIPPQRPSKSQPGMEIPRDPARKKYKMYCLGNNFAEAEAYFWDHLKLKEPFTNADVSLGQILLHIKLGEPIEED